MKKLLLVLLGLIMIFSMVFSFSGCEVVKDLQEQAELAAKALSDSGYAWYRVCERRRSGYLHSASEPAKSIYRIPC